MGLEVRIVRVGGNLSTVACGSSAVCRQDYCALRFANVLEKSLGRPQQTISFGDVAHLGIANTQTTVDG